MTTAKKTASETKAAADKMAKQAEAAVAAGKEGVEAVMKAGAEAVAKTYECSTAVAKEQIDAVFKACDTNFSGVDGYKDAAEFGKQNVEAAFKASSAALKGIQELNKAYAAFVQASMDKSMAVAQAALACGTVKELSDLQADLAKTQYGEIMSESRNLAGLGVKVAEEAVAPLRARLDAAAEMFGNAKTF